MTPLGAAHNVTVKTQVPPRGRDSNCQGERNGKAEPARNSLNLYLLSTTRL